MEDWNYLAADGVVICCCCPCAILQVIFFILLKLPYKLATKSKKLVHKRLRKNKKRKEQISRGEVVQHGGEQQIRIQGELSRILLEGVSLHPYHDCIKNFNEIEKAMEELSQQGHFQFGSFWGRDESSGLQHDVAQEKFETVLQYQFIEMIKNL